MSKKAIVILLALFYGFTLFLTLNRHSKAGVQNYHSEIWADKAGYYVYLPGFFIYDFEAKDFPKEIDRKTGHGFFLEDDKVKTKYTYGVSLLQAPFFLATHVIATTFGYDADGFSRIYHAMINVSAVTYSFFGLILLYLFLIRHVHKKVAFLTVTCLYLGTNLFYYSIFETGMSHIYSFFLFTCFLYLSPFIFKPKQSFFLYILFGLIVGLIVVIRPVNVFLLPLFFVFNKTKITELVKQIGPILIMLAAAFVTLIPQFLYWKYASGSYLFYSYSNEGFSNLFSPKLLNIWFSTNNGLFVYSPLIIFSLIGIFFLKQISVQKRILLASYFLFISVVIASWHDWTYGCSYGCRPFVEYYAVLALPLAIFLREINTQKYLRIVIWIIILLMIVYTQKIMFSYDGCWYGGNWDWQELYSILTGPTK
ncbi:hypothetical protein [Brumimicrobium oceani]|uniref:Glycosyltransferase RgtA/B/C/D-like domain-containing protein n=1 Tax=Brumimicrobium oceani TaxID=2100725 RepID=A0A2U2X5A5_9FLAO|nr:hypothetical protein [Brumimicrobium oceani]PWH82920.1 hypothetical protein DIT68_13570 [Brumimicrobium oceani]